MGYGLHAGIFTQDINKAYRIIKELGAGCVKQSGQGCEGIKYVLQEMTEPRLACFNP